MTKKFWKMHGIGNDYIYFDCFDEDFPNVSEAAVKLSDRHFSVGGDGVILVCRSNVADGKMRMFNADGSEGKMCGNGIRCVGKFLYDLKGIRKDVLTVETLSGVKTLYMKTEQGKAVGATVDMGAAVLEPSKIPANFSGESVIKAPLNVGGKIYYVTLVSMGNPHCVIFGECEESEFERTGRLFETNPVFPQSVNTEFVKVLRRNELRMRVWERGSGETFACGTGACASAVAGVLNGYCDKDTDILVHLRGGDLTIRYTDETVFMTGSATLAFTGETEI